MDETKLKNATTDLLPDIQRFLVDLMKFPSTPGQEHQAMLFLCEEFSKLNAEVEKISLSNKIKDDPDYSSPVTGIEYEGRFNLRVCRKGQGGGKTLLLNAHCDVVPASEGMADAFSGRVEGGVVYGRGACDDKGSIATIYLLFGLIERLGLELAGDVVAHIVVEEENGGNGSLAMARQGEKADTCIVLEPTENLILTSIRGAVWFRIDFMGTAGHSGQVGQTKSALLMAHEAIDILTAYHKQLLDGSRSINLFDKYENPMPITFGRLDAGNWPASAPNKATLEGVLGFLPNKTKEQICDEIKQALLENSRLLDADNFQLSFTYRHDCSVMDPGHLAVEMLKRANDLCDIESDVDAMTASCDAWFYNNQLNIPTLVYGPGTLKMAHSRDEQIRLADISDAGRVLCQFTESFCGE